MNGPAECATADDLPVIDWSVRPGVQAPQGTTCTAPFYLYRPWAASVFGLAGPAQLLQNLMKE